MLRQYLLGLYYGHSRRQLELWGAQKLHLCCLQLSADSLLPLESSTKRGYTSCLLTRTPVLIVSTMHFYIKPSLPTPRGTTQAEDASYKAVPLLPVSEHLWSRDWALQQRSTRSWTR